MLKMIEQLSIGTTDLAGIAQLTIGATYLAAAFLFMYGLKRMSSGLRTYRGQVMAATSTPAGTL